MFSTSWAEGPVTDRQREGINMYTKPVIVSVEKIEEAKAVRPGSRILMEQSN